MNAKKVLMLQTVTMYLIQIPFYLVLIFCRIPNFEFDFIGILLLVGLGLNVLMIPVLIVSLFVFIKGLGKHDLSVSHTLKWKLILVPWYLFNFMVCFLSIAGFINPFLLIAIPIVIGVEIFVTYVYMLSTSMHLFVYVCGRIVKKEIELDFKTFICLFMLFIFALDIVGTYLLCRRFKIGEDK